MASFRLLKQWTFFLAILHIYTQTRKQYKNILEKSVQPKVITFLNKGNWFLYTMRTELRFLIQSHLKKTAREETMCTRLYFIQFQSFVGYLI